ILSLSKEYYHYLLTVHEIGKAAREYLASRGVTNETIELFGLGYSPAQWDGLSKYLVVKKGYASSDVIDAGLLIKNDRGKIYDRFRDRLMFPLTDSRGNIVGFSGRILEKDAKEAKYINTPETLLYHKSQLLFGYSQMKREIAKAGEVVITEGEFDCLSSIQAHVSNTVAIKGSALTADHLKFLSRTVKRLLFALDADSAGIEATKRAITLAVDSDLSIRVIPIAGGKDPDEIARHDPAIWREMVKNSISAYEYVIDQSVYAHHGGAGGEDKREITREVLPLLSHISNAVEQAHYMKFLARKLDVTEQVVETELRKVRSPVQPSGEKVAKKESHTRAQTLIRFAVSLLFHSTSSEFEARYQRLYPLLPDGFEKRLLEGAEPFVKYFDPSRFSDSLPDELQEGFATLYLEFSEEFSPENQEKEFSRTCAELAKLTQQERRLAIAARLEELENKADLSDAEDSELRSLKVELH
ncbi:MAG TPA: toprim domain-containing protein, partial [Patescibacteria group bacterium]|nr:toprim domain-containing protein [Patescibacteria group bacterium]